MSLPTLTIVHLVDYLMPTMGYQEFLLPKWNARHGHRVHIVTSDRYTPVPNYDSTWGCFLGERKCGSGREDIEGVTVHRLPCLCEWNTRHWLIGLEETIRVLSPDLLFCHGTSSVTAFRSAVLAKRLKVPIVMDNHMTFVSQNRSISGHLYYKCLRFLSRQLLSGTVYRFLGVAKECCDFVEQEQCLPRERIESLPLGVDTDVFRPDEAVGLARRQELGIPSDAKVVLQTGKLSPDKDPLILMTAMLDIMKGDHQVWLVFVGAGDTDYLSEISRLAEQGGVSARVRFIPFVSLMELAGFYCMADVCAYPGGSSLSCLEAAACGRPVIMTDLPAGLWRAEQGIGICYRTGDSGDLKQKLDNLIRDNRYGKRVGERAREAIMTHFSYDVIARQAEALMLRAIEGGHAADA